jgi:ADP-ribosyl-[dinitrogen reductase] hydrolase
MISVVNRGGDADTTGAIYGMLAGAYYGLDDIPAAWLGGLNASVRKQCEEQALALLELAG